LPVAGTAAKRKASLVFRGGDFYVDEGAKLREDMGSLYFDISSFPGKPSDSQAKEAARIHQELLTVKAEFESLLQQDVVALNERLPEEQRLRWPAKTDFLAAESGGSDAGPQRQRWTSTTMWKNSLTTPLGADWRFFLR